MPVSIGVWAHGWKARVYQGLACSRRSVSRVRCSDGGERVLFLRQFFERALLSERLEQANQGLALPKVETPGQTRHPPPLSDAVAKER